MGVGTNHCRIGFHYSIWVSMIGKLPGCTCNLSLNFWILIFALIITFILTIFIKCCVNLSLNLNFILGHTYFNTLILLPWITHLSQVCNIVINIEFWSPDLTELTRLSFFSAANLRIILLKICVRIVPLVLLVYLDQQHWEIYCQILTIENLYNLV